MSEIAFGGDDRSDILGVQVSAINLADAVATVERWIRQGGRNYVCVTGVRGDGEPRERAAARYSQPRRAGNARRHASRLALAPLGQEAHGASVRPGFAARAYSHLSAARL